ncbi:type III secretion system export apparatus subunit SctT [Vibrio coralliilyticus]|uniref:EscT/YscT/HrcT family type III secretion system export apparatus protein n=2 Tax=Vibrio coralliilyticus TaxID=190893 RepID=A0AAP6ZSH2_9VIBR|nr:type III secretion system export apparatus subunit SctT [Vibrio coralliilyticus]AXN30479.1 EscT/YscT/HrcT family type III secretion system export apparatus protein [Vibrio coralliilyticus]ERB63038.1 type III secretion protein [Vibrio coralliilyticus OCN008]KPH26866.1 type III secretion protein [Vibrio coralliilyticus]MCC2524056.1 type III secretion system export apparatus subunit SctT [Vibrio coralliilyticus]NOJ23294.1 EscT/YscT/HrcT family type III secretion system export apparatus protein
MATLMQYVPILALCMMRPLGMMIMLPLFKGGAMGSGLIRNTLVLMFALPIIPMMQAHPVDFAAKPLTELTFIYGEELLIGLIVGFCAAIPFWAIDMAGFVIDTMRGASMSTVLNPLMGLQSSVFGMFFTQILGVLFLVSGGFNALLTALYQSYTVLPPESALSFNQDLLSFISQQWQMMSDMCLSFALPAMVVMIMVDVALGLVNRSVEQLNVFFLSMPIKSILVVFLLLVSMHFALSHYLNQINQFESNISTLFQLFKG